MFCDKWPFDKICLRDDSSEGLCVEEGRVTKRKKRNRVRLMDEGAGVTQQVRCGGVTRSRERFAVGMKVTLICIL